MVRSQGDWLRSPRSPGAGVSMLLSGTEAMGSLGGACLMVGGSGLDTVGCGAMIVLGLILACG